MKIALITAAWKRPQLFEFFCWYWSEIARQLNPDVQLTIYCAVSEKQSETIAAKYGIRTIFVLNDPLHKKWNEVTRLARADRPDYCLFLGSDDLCNGALIREYARRMALPNAAGYLATLDWYFFDTATKKGIYWAGYRENYRHGEPCGAGRALSAAILDCINWCPWIPGYDGMLDTAFQKQMKGIPHTKDFFKLGDVPGCVGIDIKTGVNMTPFREWDNTNSYDVVPFLINSFDEATANKMLELKP